MTQQNELSPTGKTGAQLVDAIWAAFRAGRTDLHQQVALLLHHDDPVVREEAISLLLIKWKDARYRATALNVLDHDEDFGVRGQAALGLALISTAATRGDDLSILAQVLRNPEEDTETRRAAYEALLILDRREDFPSSTKGFDPDRDVDWKWLSTLETS